MSSVANLEFEKLLLYLKQTRGFDFGAYKRASLMRRMEKRIQMLNINSFSDYVDFLEVHHDEFSDLFNTILINVTAFFRDADAWEFVRDEIIPAILGRKGQEDPIRVWAAGCASGEEAYSIAMLLNEAMGDVAFRERVKVYATDVDEEALVHSRNAAYSAKDVSVIPGHMVDKFFERAGENFIIGHGLRRAVIFGRHDLIKDAPISRVDLLICRNTLMYFNADAQKRILSRFHFALNEGGYLFLGKAETMVTHGNLFTPIDLKCRVFTRARNVKGFRESSSLLVPSATETVAVAPDTHIRLREAVLESTPNAHVVIDTKGRIYHVNERARQFFGLHIRDIGRPIQDLEISYRPVDLRSAVEQALAQRKTIDIYDVPWHTPGKDSVTFEIKIAPLHEDGRNLGVVITFSDVTQFKRLQTELVNFSQELETAYEELQSTNEELQTTNEELQSTVEELETTNEELQSTNEELETMNEELHSTNAELETINVELRLRSDQLNEANAFLNSILGSLESGVMVLNRDLCVIAWNKQSEDLWGLRSDEAVTKHFLNLDIGFPTNEIRSEVKQCLSTGEPARARLAGVNRRGKAVDCEVVITALRGSQEQPRGVIILIEALPRN